MNNYKKYAWEAGKFLFLLLLLVVLQHVFFPSPQKEEWRSLPPELLQAKSQSDIAEFLENYKLDDTLLQSTLNTLGISLTNFKSSVKINFLLDFPRDKKYGLTFVFITEIDHELLSPVYTIIVNDFLDKFQKKANKKLEVDANHAQNN